MVSERLREADHRFDSSRKAAGDPGAEEFTSGVPGRQSPKTAKVFFQEVGLKQRFVERLKPFKVEEGIVIEFLATPEKKKTASFQDLSLGALEVAIHIASCGIDGRVCQRNDVVRVVDDCDFWKDISYSEQIGGPHIHGHRLEWRPHSFESPKEGNDGISASTLCRMKDFAFFKIQDDGHVLVTLANRELVDCNQSDRLQRSFPQPAA